MRNRTEIIKDIKKLQKFIQVASLENPMHMGEYQKQLEDLQNELSQTTEESFGEQFTTAGHDQLNPPRNPEATEDWQKHLPVGQTIDGLECPICYTNIKFEENTSPISPLKEHLIDRHGMNMIQARDLAIQTAEDRTDYNWSHPKWESPFAQEDHLGIFQPLVDSFRKPKLPKLTVEEFGKMYDKLGSDERENMLAHIQADGASLEELRFDQLPLYVQTNLFYNHKTPTQHESKANEDFYEAGMVQPNDPRGWVVDRSDVKRTGHDIYMDMAVKDHIRKMNDPNFKGLTNQDYEDVYNSGYFGLRESKANEIKQELERITGVSSQGINVDDWGKLYEGYDNGYHWKFDCDICRADPYWENPSTGEGRGAQHALDHIKYDHNVEAGDTRRDIIGRESKATEGIDEHGVLEYIKSNHPVNFRTIRKFNLNPSLRETLNGILNKLQSLGYINEEIKGWVPTRTSLGGTYNESKATELDWKKFTKDFFDLDKSHLDIHDLIEQQNTDAKIQDDESFQLPHIYNQAKQKVILDIEAKIRDLDQSDMDPLHIDMLKDELKREKEIALNELMHSEFDQMTDHNNPSFGITTALGDDGYAHVERDRPWRTESKASEDMESQQRGLSDSEEEELMEQTLEEWQTRYLPYESAGQDVSYNAFSSFAKSKNLTQSEIDYLWNEGGANPYSSESKANEANYVLRMFDHTGKMVREESGFVNKQQALNRENSFWEDIYETDHFGHDSGYKVTLEEDGKDISDMTFSTEGGNGSGKKGHKQWMNPADRIENIKSEDLKREKFLTRARELYEQYAPDDEYLDMFKALKDD